MQTVAGLPTDDSKQSIGYLAAGAPSIGNNAHSVGCRLFDDPYVPHDRFQDQQCK